MSRTSQTWIVGPLLLLVNSTSCGFGECLGVYYERTDSGELKKFKEELRHGQCMTDNLPLSAWEASLERRRKAGVQCAPQPEVPNSTLVTRGNYYSYRDDRLMLRLDSSTGIFRKLLLAEDRSGNPVFSRLEGCFWQRTGIGADAAFGTQLLLDSTLAASTGPFDPMEVYRVTWGASVEMARFDSISDWTYQFCPEATTPWGYCDLLRNGNEMYYPALTAQQQSDLEAEAILVRTQFSFEQVSNAEFDAAWSAAEAGRREVDRREHAFEVAHLADVPLYVDRAWFQYVRGQRPHMPDVTSPTIPPVCYPAHRLVTLSDGSTSYLTGEVCYVGGQYQFTSP
jgi:hypothetical protein